MSSRRGTGRRVAERLGITSAKPKPSPRQALAAALWALPFVVVAALLATAVGRADGPQWLRLLILVSPVWVFIGLVGRGDRNDP